MSNEMKGVRPNDWRTGTIKNTSYLKGRIGWQGLRANEFTTEGPYLITGTDFANGRIDWNRCYHVSWERYEQAGPIHIKNGDILITKDGTIGKIAFIDNCPEHAVLNSGIFLLRCEDGSYDHKYMYHLLISPLFDSFLRENLAGSTITHLYQNVFERFSFPIPDPKEQNRISKILDAADEAIAKTEALIAKLKAIKQGLLHDLLTRGLDEDGQLRDPERHPEQFKESPLGLIPRDWTIQPLSDLADVDRGKFMHRPRNDPRFYGGEHPFVQTGDVAAANGRLLNTFSQTLNARGASVSQEFPEGTIAITIAANIADTAILGRPMYFPDSIVGAIVRSPNVIRYIELWIRYRKNWLSAQAPQSAQKNINLETLRPLLVPVPNPEEQHEIAKTYDLLDSKIQSEEDYLSKLKAIKKGLMHDLLTGSVRVKVQARPTES